MKTIRNILLLTTALGLTALAHASPFDFSYAFGDGSGTVVTGTLTGTANGNFVDNVANVTLFLNGNQIGTTLFTAYFDDTAINYAPGAVVSFDATLNNFIFVDSDLGHGDFGYDTFFTILNGSQFAPDNATALSGSLGVFAIDSPANASWTLTQVPETGSTAALLGATVVGLAWFRRRSLQRA